jgi:hypothetical protein
MPGCEHHGGVSAVPSPWAQAWGTSGLAYLTGLPDGPPDFSRANVLTRAERIAADAATLLTGRAALLGLTRAGRVSAGGATRLIEARDSWCALTLSRPDDVAAVPALLQADEVPEDHWPVLERWAATRPVAEIRERAGLLDIPAAVLGEAGPARPRICRTGSLAPERDPASLLVADLSSMWAGPLCGQLLARAGSTVVKVESPRRPDGTRSGNRAFFDWMNGGKLSYCLDFDRHAGELCELLSVADIVIEGSRPAALTRRGLGPDQIASRAGRVWLRITGHGGRSTRPAFGDDAAVAGGLVGSSTEGPVFCGDAIADPLAGLEAAWAVAESLSRGGGELIEVSMAAVAATYAALPTEPPTHASSAPHPVAPPATPPPAEPAAGLGADNDTVRRMVGELLSC